MLIHIGNNRWINPNKILILAKDINGYTLQLEGLDYSMFINNDTANELLDLVNNSAETFDGVGK